jgi:hypothetical protein
MKAISFGTQSAQRVYNDYIQRCRRATSILSAKDKEEVLLERLGAPEETLKEIVADKKIGQATLTFNPKHLVQALLLNLTNGVIYIVLFVLFLFEIAFPVLIILKLIYPDHVGLYTKSNGGFLYGYVSKAGSGGISVGYSNHAERTEILGLWFIPATLLVAVLIYIGIVFLLKVVKKNKKITR